MTNKDMFKDAFPQDKQIGGESLQKLSHSTL